MPRSRFYYSALWRYDADELAKVAIRAAPTLIMPAICDMFIPVAPYRIDVNCIAENNFAIIDFRQSPDNDLVEALKTAFFKAYNPLQEQILGITSLYSDDPTPRFDGIIRAHDISTPAFKGMISHHEIIAITRCNADKYMEFMNRIARSPSGHRNLLIRSEYETRVGNLSTIEPAYHEKISRFFASRSARFDLATAYKNHLGLHYPDCKDVSVFFGSPDWARESDPQIEAEIKAKGFRGVISLQERDMFRLHLELVCNSELFDDHVVRMTADMPSTMAYHATYLGMAMFQCGLSEKEGKDAMKKCEECKSWLLHPPCLC